MPIRVPVRVWNPANRRLNSRSPPSSSVRQPIIRPGANTGLSAILRIEPRKGTKAMMTSMTARVRIMPIHKAGARLNRSQALAIQVQPCPAGTRCPSATKFCCGVMADPPWLFLLQSYPYRGNRLGDQRAVLVFRLALDEDHAAAVLQHPRFGEQPCPTAAADEGGAQVDGDHAQGVRMKRARRRAQRDVEQRHDYAAVDGADAVGEMGLDRQREPRASLAERLGEDLEVRDERNALLVVAREGEPGVAAHITLAPPSTAIACPVM